MATIRQTAGKSTRKMEADRRSSLNDVRKAYFVIAVIACVYALLVGFQVIPITWRTLLIVLLLCMVVIIFDAYLDRYTSRQRKLIRRAEKGAIAEEKIGDLLERLGEGFVVLHDIESPYGNIDHVVISQKGGILLLETKSHNGKIQVTEEKILVNGKMPEKDFVQQALKNSYWLREEINALLEIKPWITPVVVFTNAFVPFGKPVKGVRVTNAKYLLEIIEGTRSRSPDNAKIWENRAKIAWLLTRDDLGQPLDQVASAPAKFCPKCGKALIARIALRGPRKGLTLMVCPDYPACYVALDEAGQILPSRVNT